MKGGPLVIIILIVAGMIGFLTIFSLTGGPEKTQTAVSEAGGGYGTPAESAGGYGAPAESAGGYGAPAPAAGGYGAPATGGYGVPASGGH